MTAGRPPSSGEASGTSGAPRSGEASGVSAVTSSAGSSGADAGAAARSGSPLAGLVASSRTERVRSVREVEASIEAVLGVRRVLFADRDAEVRAAAAWRLGDLAAAGFAADAVESWLLDAIGDGSPLVRDAIVRALARVGTRAAVPALRELAAGDLMWWVRRGAIYALAAVAGAAELPALTRALADPFWRVRHAAVKVLAVLGARDPRVRDEVTATGPAAGEPADATAGYAASTLAFLRGTWGPVAIEAPARATAPSRLPPELLDPDPAVVTARLEAGGFEPLALVELLCDPHVPLRLLAVRRLADAGDLGALEAALDWLEEPRIPHVADTVYELLDGLGDPAAELAARALARRDRPGAGRWAIGWVVATQSGSLAEAALERARAGDASLRRAAIRLAGEAELRAWAEAEPALVDPIAAELHARHRPAAHDTLLALDGAAHPRARALQIDALARRGAWAAVEAGLTDPHHGPRALAARWWVRHDRRAAVALGADRDPSVREAALVPETAPAALGDLDPWVRRAAIRMLASAWGGAPALPAELADTACAALIDVDPVVRGHACRLPIADDRALARVLERLVDRSPGVRAAAHDAIESLDRADARIEAVLAAGSLPRLARSAALSWLARGLDAAAGDRARAALATESDARIRSLLEAIAGASHAPDTALAAPGNEVDGTADANPVDANELAVAGPSIQTHTEISSTAATTLAPREHRPFGRAGFAVAPLAISGAYDLSPPLLQLADHAGVDLYFWEPGYDALTRFLRARERRARVRVLTGTYHADARSIRLDVDRALRTLRRDALDAFLLFWTRSPARLDEAAFDTLDSLRRAGKIRAIGFSTHHRAIAREAIEARPWDVVMTRHSAAHPGIETELLPTARAHGTAIVTFSALTYGRMLSGPDAPSPAECYRYSLSQPGVTACISAPRRRGELLENLAVLDEPHLAPERITALRAHGARVHAESQRFNTLVRQPTRDAAAAAREMLAAELPPDSARTDAALRAPAAGTTRRSRSRLGAPSRRAR